MNVKNVGKASCDIQLFENMVTHSGDLPYKCQKCEKVFFFIPVIFEFMKAFTMERSPISVNNVEKPLNVLKVSKYMIEFTEVINAMNVSDVVKASIISVTSRSTKDIIQERHHVYVKDVLKY